MKRFLDFEERKIIEELKREGLKYPLIGEKINKSTTCIRHEFAKFTKAFPGEPYNAEKAQMLADENRKRKAYKRPSQIYLEQNHERFLALIEEGHGARYLAQAFRVNKSAILAYARILNIQFNDSLNPKSLEERICSLEMQMEILTQLIKEIHK